MTQTPFGIVALLCVAGAGIPVMAAMNAGLGIRIGNPMTAVFMLCVVATIGSGIIMAVVGPANPANLFKAPPLYYFAGLLFVLYIASMTFFAPKIGVGNAVMLILCGQLIAAAIIDHFGLMSAAITHLTPRRALGLLLMGIGVVLARWN